MAELQPSAPLEVLSDLHARLDTHFRDLRTQRESLGGNARVFALEHDLQETDLDSLKSSVQYAVEHGFCDHYRHHAWLPYVVYAAEAGYDYVGNDFWPSFERLTPGWKSFGRRDWIRERFVKFALDYRGAIPQGGFAENFTIIAWPITHAVLPVYLQRYLAQLLYEFRMGLTTRLLQQPEELGEQLAARTRTYTERFRIFCTNTSLLGHVATALLSGEGESPPYLQRATLLRLVGGLEQEREARLWLQGARAAASSVRARGFQPSPARAGGSDNGGDRLPIPADPRLVLRRTERGWRAYAQLPDLSGLDHRLPHVYDQLRTRRARVEGADDTIMARGRLATLGQEVRLSRWPRSDRPFVELEDGEQDVNSLLRDQVQISRGPIWLFKQRAAGLATEVKSRLVHPGNTYYLVCDTTWHPTAIPGVTPVRSDIAEVSVVKLSVPENLTDEDCAALVGAGLSVQSDVAIRPVGIAASLWDGEGSVEWMAGEPGLVGIRAEHLPTRVTLNMAGERCTLDWPADQQELFLSLEDLPIGEHELRVCLAGGDLRALVEGSLFISIRDPEVGPDSAQAGAGIRLLTSPPRPSMSELWEPDAVAIAGPEGVRVDLAVILRSETGQEIAKVQTQARVPVSGSDWLQVANHFRSEGSFKNNFDLAESLLITVSKAGVGHASLTADRGFQPLRWRVIRERGRSQAHLIDRTDAGTTRVELFRVERPLVPEAQTAEDVSAPASGGLLRASAARGIDATILLPPTPSEMLGSTVRPDVQTTGRTSADLWRLVEGHHLWANADLPGDPFAQYQRDRVLEAIAQTLMSLTCGPEWSGAELRLATADDPLESLYDDMRYAIGDSREHLQLGRTIAQSFWKWQDPASLLAGFAEVSRAAWRSSGLQSRVLLILASNPGQLAAILPIDQRDNLLRKVLTSPALLRAARFAVIGARLNHPQQADWRL